VPGGPFGDQTNPLLSGLFGTFQEGAAAGADTASLWSSLRQAAASWWYGANGLPLPASTSVLESTGASLLHEQGVTIFNVNTYRQVAGNWAQAKANLMALNPADQIPGEAIFTPPWATTTAAGVPDRYRIRVNWEWSPEGEAPTSKWAAYELTGPVSSVNNALGQALSLAQRDDYWVQLTQSATPQAVSYEIEQI
jgi:hypothetical protein